MNAYAILDGGGVKGAALAGCLNAADEIGINFVAFGGTSAGSIVALLASIGYTPQQIKDIMVDEVEFENFLDDNGVLLKELKGAVGRVFRRRLWGTNWIRKPWRGYREAMRWWDAFQSDLGLYKGSNLTDFLLKKIWEKLPGLRENAAPTFNDLYQNGAKPLKVVASDLGTCSPVVYSNSGGKERNGPVLDAVRASISYPFVFQPMKVADRLLVDGGLSSNLPVFLFEEEREETGLPVVAFDLVSSGSPKATPYGLNHFCNDMLSICLEAGDEISRQLIKNIYHVKVKIPADISAMDFDLKKGRRSELFNCGHAATSTFFSKKVPHWAAATDEIARLQATFGAEPDLINGILEVITSEVELISAASDIRACVMLPNGTGRQYVVYQFGMDSDPDLEIDLAIDAGISGRAWTSKEPVIAPVFPERREPADAHMTDAEHNRIRQDRRTIASFPIFDLGSRVPEVKAQKVPVLGTFNIDSSSELDVTGWMHDFFVDRGIFWADVLSKLLRP